MDRRALGIGRKPNAQAPRRPARRLGVRSDSMSAALSRSAFSVLTRRSSGAREASAAPSSRARVAEGAREMRIEPFRIIAGDMRPAHRCMAAAIEALRVHRRSAPPGRSASRRQVCAMASASNPRSRLSMPSRTARGVSSPMSQALGGAPAQRVVDQPGDAARSPEPAKRCARPQALSASAAGRRSSAMRCEDFDCRGKPRGWRHGRTHGRPARMRTAKITHIASNATRAEAVPGAAAHDHVAGGVDQRVHQTRQPRTPRPGSRKRDRHDG